MGVLGELRGTLRRPSLSPPLQLPSVNPQVSMISPSTAVGYPQPSPAIGQLPHRPSIPLNRHFSTPQQPWFTPQPLSVHPPTLLLRLPLVNPSLP